MNHSDLIREVTLQIEDGKNTIQIKERRESSDDGNGKHDWSQAINKEETDSKRVIALNEGYQSWRQRPAHRKNPTLGFCTHDPCGKTW